jgi:hypothetical protein
MSIDRLDEAERLEAEQLYRAIADGETTEQLLQRFYDFAGDAAGLRPPLAELNLARMCGPRQEPVHG